MASRRTEPPSQDETESQKPRPETPARTPEGEAAARRRASFAETSEIDFEFGDGSEYVPVPRRGEDEGPSEGANGGARGRRARPAQEPRGPGAPRGGPPQRRPRPDRERRRATASPPGGAIPPPPPPPPAWAARSATSRASRSCVSSSSSLGLGLLASVSTVFGMMAAVSRTCRRSRLRQVQGLEEQRRLGLQRQEDRDPDQQQQQDPARLRPDLDQHQERRGRDRGLALLRAQRRRLPGHRPRPDPGHPLPVGRTRAPRRSPSSSSRTRSRRRAAARSCRSSARPRSPTGSSATGRKDKILTEYLNTIYFGEGAYGIEAAARTYFGMEPPEAAATTDEPCAAVLEPREAAHAGRDHRLALGLSTRSQPETALAPPQPGAREDEEQGYITESRLRTRDPHRAARRRRTSSRRQIDSEAPYFTSWLRQQLVDRYGPGAAFFGGLQVKTTLDLDLQNAPRRRSLSSYLGGIAPTASVVVLDNHNARGQGDGRRAQLRRSSPSTSPPRATASRVPRSSRSSSRRR